MTAIIQQSQMELDRASAVKTIDSEIETINRLKGSLKAENLTRALDYMQNSKGRIIITGMGKSGHIGKKIAASLASTGTPSFFVHPAEASHGDLGMITEEDVVIAISNSGESKELIDILNYCKRFGIKLIAITKNPESSLGKAGDIVLELPNNGEACPLGLAPTNSTTATLVLGDILTVGMIERKGFSKEAFNDRHPGGKLGSILKRVSDLMHTGQEMPILDENSNMQAVLLEMTSKRLGCVGFINEKGELTGMLTDGHLQRPTQQATLYQFLQRSDRRTQSVERIRKAEPRVQTEHPPILLHRFHHPLTFANRTSHRFFTPNVFPCFRSLHRHDTMPMRRRRDMDNIDIRIQNQIAEIMISRNLLFHQVLTQFQMFLVYVAHRYQARASVIQMASSHPAGTDNTFRQLITRSYISIPQHVPRHDGKERNPSQSLQKISSVCFHSKTILLNI